MTVQIKLYRSDLTTIVDDEDGDLANRRWSLSRSRNRLYVQGKDEHGRMVKLHKLILQRKIGRPLRRREVTDHKNGDSLDNQRENIRLATNLLNRWNVGPANSTNRTGYRGVLKHRNRFQAWIQGGGGRKYLGTYDTAEEAHHAYQRATIERYGAFSPYAEKDEDRAANDQAIRDRVDRDRQAMYDTAERRWRYLNCASCGHRVIYHRGHWNGQMLELRGCFEEGCHCDLFVPTPNVRARKEPTE